MQYLLLLTNAPDAWEDPTVDEAVDHAGGDGVFDDWAGYTRALHEAGVLVSGAALHGTDTATSVRVRDGQRLVSDGPFADTKEHLIGFYIIDVPDLDPALAWAARVPSVRTGTVEVRPLVPGLSAGEVLAAGASGEAGDASP
jgi:hypothetical protein